MPPEHTPTKCCWMHGHAFTWWDHKSSAALQPWINHAECEILPQEKPCDRARRVRDSHIYVTAISWIPRKLIRGSFGTDPSCYSNVLCHPSLSFLVPRSSGKKLRQFHIVPPLLRAGMMQVFSCSEQEVHQYQSLSQLWQVSIFNTHPTHRGPHRDTR